MTGEYSNLNISAEETETLRMVHQELAKWLPGGTETYLFGSRARRDHREDSDYDIICVLPDPEEDQWPSLSASDVMDAVDLAVKTVNAAAEVNLEFFTAPGFENAIWEYPFLKTAQKDMVSLGGLPVSEIHFYRGI